MLYRLNYHHLASKIGANLVRRDCRAHERGCVVDQCSVTPLGRSQLAPRTALDALKHRLDRQHLQFELYPVLCLKAGRPTVNDR